MILAGDIGGTNTRLALFEKGAEGWRIRFAKTFPSRERMYGRASVRTREPMHFSITLWKPGRSGWQRFSGTARVLSLDWLLFFTLLTAAGAQLYWGLRTRERHWQFPTLAAACWVFYMLPMAFGALRNPAKFPPAALDDGGLTIALVMCLLCVIATWHGWNQGLRGNKQPPAAGEEGRRLCQLSAAATARLFDYGCAVFLLGLWGAWKLAALMGGFRTQFTGGGNYDTEWVGAPVKYVFFAGLIYPGFLFAFRSWRERKQGWRGLVVILIAVYPMAVSVFLGRRGATCVFLCILVLSLFFCCRWSLPPAGAALLYVAAGVAVIGAPEYRGVASTTGDVRQAVAGGGVREGG